MNELIFLVRHTPFWAVPVLVLSLEFGYIFWLRKKMSNFRMCLIAAIIASLFLSFYVFSGGPEKSVTRLMKTIQRF